MEFGYVNYNACTSDAKDLYSGVVDAFDVFKWGVYEDGVHAVTKVALALPTYLGDCKMMVYDFEAVWAKLASLMDVIYLVETLVKNATGIEQWVAKKIDGGAKLDMFLAGEEVADFMVNAFK